MYVTAQRVLSLTPGHREGINAFLSLHAGPEYDDVDWQSPSVTTLVEERRGIVQDIDADLNPGGNRVRSFLDVVAHDQTELARIEEALDDYRKFLEEEVEELPAEQSQKGVGIRFYADASLTQAREEALDEYELLRKRVIRLLKQQPPRP